MERKFVPLTKEQVDAAISGELKLITMDGRNVESLRRNGSLLTVFLKDNKNIYKYPETGYYDYIDDSDLDLCIETEPTPKTINVAGKEMSLKQALIFISNMITEQ